MATTTTSDVELSHIDYKTEAAKPEKKKPSFWREMKVYAGRVSEFTKTDWIVFFVWVGLMVGLMVSVTAFLLIGHSNGVTYPAYVWNIPLGILIFGISISFDTIGHRTVYYVELQKAEALIHHLTIFLGITSTILLCLAYHYPVFLKVPALVTAVMSIIYSLFDDVMHWIRYYTKNSDRVEMWAHLGIFIGHGMFLAAWIWWYLAGYEGVAETIPFLPGF